MLRSTLGRSLVTTAVRYRATSQITRVVIGRGARFNSTQTPPARSEEERKLRNKLREELLEDWTAPILSYEEVKQKSQEPSEDAYLIDVREPDEVVQGMIPSAVNLPLSSLSGALHLDGEQFQEKYGFKKPASDQEVVFYCRSGMRSASAGDVARRNGYKNIWNYKGSWLDWTAREGKTSP
ncbi:Rhodanese-like protein [Gloeopeniophorella convolvens]|nr:Rhodanese-like protein [Gloeopeniophorella convolvens]